MATRLNPVYFENQKQAASILGFEVHDLKEWKAAGCPAFRHARIYHAELLEWQAKHRPNARRRVERLADLCDAPNPECAVARAMLGLTECVNFGVLTDDQFFELGKEIVEAAGNEEIRRMFTDQIYRRLRRKYSELLDAFNAHPEITHWVVHEKLITPEERAESAPDFPDCPEQPQEVKNKPV